MERKFQRGLPRVVQNAKSDKVCTRAGVHQWLPCWFHLFIAEEKFLSKLSPTGFKVYAPNNKCHLNLIFVVKPEEGRWKDTQFFIEVKFPDKAPKDYPMYPPHCKLMDGFKVQKFASSTAWNYLAISRSVYIDSGLSSKYWSRREHLRRS